MDNNGFSLNSQTGELKSDMVFDYETKSEYSLMVVATDSGLPQHSTTQHFTVQIMDINDSAPRFSQDHQLMTVNENVPIGTIVGFVKATDSDSGDNSRIDYYVTGGNKFGIFDVNRTTGAISVQRPVDYEEATTHALKIRASDNAVRNQKSSLLDVFITVVDKNDNAPVFSEDPVIIDVYENEQQNTLLYKFHAYDQDSGSKGRVRYHIVTSQSDDVSGLISLDSRTGELTLIGALDYEVFHHLSFLVEATDQDTRTSDRLSSTVYCVISIRDQNDNAPVFVGRLQVNYTTNIDLLVTKHFLFTTVQIKLS